MQRAARHRGAKIEDTEMGSASVLRLREEIARFRLVFGLATLVKTCHWREPVFKMQQLCGKTSQLSSQSQKSKSKKLKSTVSESQNNNQLAQI